MGMQAGRGGCGRVAITSSWSSSEEWPDDLLPAPRRWPATAILDRESPVPAPEVLAFLQEPAHGKVDGDGTLPAPGRRRADRAGPARASGPPAPPRRPLVAAAGAAAAIALVVLGLRPTWSPARRPIVEHHPHHACQPSRPVERSDRVAATTRTPQPPRPSPAATRCRAARRWYPPVVPTCHRLAGAARRPRAAPVDDARRRRPRPTSDAAKPKPRPAAAQAPRPRPTTARPPAPSQRQRRRAGATTTPPTPGASASPTSRRGRPGPSWSRRCGAEPVPPGEPTCSTGPPRTPGTPAPTRSRQGLGSVQGDDRLRGQARPGRRTTCRPNPYSKSAGPDGRACERGVALDVRQILRVIVSSMRR